jgi:hypothetical protein
VHTDVGRGYDDHVPGDIADITFAWMVDQCRDHLAFNDRMVRRLLERGDFKEPVGEHAMKLREEKVHKARHWGLADVHNSMEQLIFKLGGSTTRTPGRYIFKAKNITRSSTSGSGFITDSKIVTKLAPERGEPWYNRLWTTVWGVFGSQAGDGATLAPVWTSESIHPSVRIRMMHDPTYDPPALRGFKLMYDQTRNHWTWVKEWTTADGVVRKKKLHEYQIEDPSFARHTVTTDFLEAGVGQEVPLPPRKTNQSWFGLW